MVKPARLASTCDIRWLLTLQGTLPPQPDQQNRTATVRKGLSLCLRLPSVCYGSWLPGQAGAVDRAHNFFGNRLPDANRNRQREASSCGNHLICWISHGAESFSQPFLRSASIETGTWCPRTCVAITYTWLAAGENRGTRLNRMVLGRTGSAAVRYVVREQGGTKGGLGIAHGAGSEGHSLTVAITCRGACRT